MISHTEYVRQNMRAGWSHFAWFCVCVTLGPAFLTLGLGPILIFAALIVSPAPWLAGVYLVIGCIGFAYANDIDAAYERRGAEPPCKLPYPGSMP